MLGDDEHPISFVFEPRVDGAHVKVVVRAGLRGMRALAGELTFRPEEWVVFREAIGRSVVTAEDERLAKLMAAPDDAKAAADPGNTIRRVMDAHTMTFYGRTNEASCDAPGCGWVGGPAFSPADQTFAHRRHVGDAIEIALRRTIWDRAVLATIDGRMRPVHLDVNPVEIGVGC